LLDHFIDDGLAQPDMTWNWASMRKPNCIARSRHCENKIMARLRRINENVAIRHSPYPRIVVRKSIMRSYVREAHSRISEMPDFDVQTFGMGMKLTAFPVGGPAK